jgi:hypothetical protein
MVEAERDKRSTISFGMSNGPWQKKARRSIHQGAQLSHWYESPTPLLGHSEKRYG